MSERAWNTQSQTRSWTRTRREAYRFQVRQFRLRFAKVVVEPRAFVANPGDLHRERVAIQRAAIQGVLRLAASNVGRLDALLEAADRRVPIGQLAHGEGHLLVAVGDRLAILPALLLRLLQQSPVPVVGFAKLDDLDLQRLRCRLHLRHAVVCPALSLGDRVVCGLRLTKLLVQIGLVLLQLFDALLELFPFGGIGLGRDLDVGNVR